MVQPKKSLGQHFLKDANIARKIAGAIQNPRNLPVLEIGPGTGILTRELEKRFRDEFFAIEIDQRAHEFLVGRYPAIAERLMHNDFLKMDLGAEFPAGLVLAGNLPYHISSPIFFSVLAQRQTVKEMVCMIQKEVAERIAAGPGSRSYGILSVFLQAFYDVEILFHVSPQVFDPPPRVQSSVLRLTRNAANNLECDEKLFFRLVKTAFNQRRKMLRNSLKAIITGTTDRILFGKKRPEQLSVEDFISLTQSMETRA